MQFKRRADVSEGDTCETEDDVNNERSSQQRVNPNDSNFTLYVDETRGELMSPVNTSAC